MTAIQKDYERWSYPHSLIRDVPPKGTNVPAEGNETFPPKGTATYNIKTVKTTYIKQGKKPTESAVVVDNMGTTKIPYEQIPDVRNLVTDSAAWGRALLRLKAKGLKPRLDGDTAIFTETGWRVLGAQGWVDWGDGIKGHLTFKKG